MATTIDDYIATLDGAHAEVATTLREHLDAHLKEGTGQLWHGHPVWMNGTTPVAGFKAYPKYVTFMLWRGQDVEDASGTLTPSGSGTMANVKFATVADIDIAALDEWLRVTIDLEG